MQSRLQSRLFILGTSAACAVAAFSVHSSRARQLPPIVAPTPLVTGKYITPEGTNINIGSYPVNMIKSPNGRFLVTTNVGARSFVSVLNSDTGEIVSQIGFNAASTVLRGKRQAIYYGLAFGKTDADGKTPLYVARGAEQQISILSLDATGTLTDTNQVLNDAVPDTVKDYAHYVAGLATSGTGDRLFVAHENGDPKRAMRGSVESIGTAAGGTRTIFETPGYVYAIAAITTGANADKKIYAASEQMGVVTGITLATGKGVDIRVGATANALLLNKAQDKLFVSNGGSDTVSIIDTNTDKVTATIPLPPVEARGLAGATPTGLALSPDEKTLYVTLADMNAVAVVDVDAKQTRAYIPVGWYPTSVAVSEDGKKLFVANAKGVNVRNPNKTATDSSAGGTRGTYIQNIIEGTVSVVMLPNTGEQFATLTQKTLANNRLSTPRTKLFNPGIKHVFYIIKENRTYDQVLSDIPGGNGDPSLLMFGRDVTPNQHALAERFVLLDNFYCTAEVSGDGWNTTTAGYMAPFGSRRVVHGYTGHDAPYDYEGTNNEVAVDLKGIPDVNRPAGGWIWDNAAKNKVTFRNYGMYAADLDEPRLTPEEGSPGTNTVALQKVLTGQTSLEFRPYDTRYPDSEAAKILGLAPAPGQRLTHGKQKDPARITAWKREFGEYVKTRTLPRLNLIRFGRDHTAGTSPGQSSPRAMVADNDYAVGQVVEAVSKSPYWESSLIIVLEDDSQAGQDHVDAHRSICFVVSPYIRSGLVDSRFYNSDSALRTIETMLGMPPVNQTVAASPPFAVFTDKAVNNAPFTAILPDKAIVGEVNTRTAYRAQDSVRLFAATEADSDDPTVDAARNDILWHAVKGKTPMPAPRYSGVRANIKR